MPRTPTFDCAGFGDPDSGNTHLKTQWQLSNNSTYTDVFWDYIDTDSDKTSEPLHGTLNYGIRYYLRVRYADNHGNWSNWTSDVVAWDFTTIKRTDMTVSPSDGLSSSGKEGGPFSPSGKTYTVKNTGGGTLLWSVSKTKNWVSLSKTGGSLGAGQSTTMTVSINTNANSLSAGSQSDTVSFNNNTNGLGNTSRPISLSISAQPNMTVSPSDGLSSSGQEGGSFSPSGKTYTVKNTGGGTLLWSVSKTKNWVSLSKTGGSLGAEQSTTMTVSINSNANSLPEGSHSDTVSFTNNTNNQGNTSRNVSLSVSGQPNMTVSPSYGLSSSGQEGGPFSPSGKTYTVKNTGGGTLLWSVSKTKNWVSLSKTGGSLGAEQSTTMIVSINSNANSLPAGSDSDTVSFTNNTNDQGNTSRNVSLSVSEVKPTVSIVATKASAAEPANNGYFTVSRTGSISGTLRVYYNTGVGINPATPGIDYEALPGYVDIPSGQSSAPISVVVIDDSQVENTETVRVSLSSDSAYDIDPGHSSATVNIADDDEETPPEISGLLPESNSIQAARDTIIQLHVTDSGSGVAYDGGTVTIQVEDDLIYDGANENPEGVYDSTGNSQAVKGVCTRTGTAADYTFIFQPSTSFYYEQKVDVTVNATDKAGNVMPEETYYFYTEMRSFAANAKVNSDIGLLVQNRPATAMDSAGNIWVVWDETTAAGNTDIYIGKLPADGSAFKASVPVIKGLDDQRNPAIAIDGSDKLYVVWQGDDPNGYWDIFASTSTNGTNWSNPVKVFDGDPHNESDQTSPAIAIDGDGKAYIAWEDNRKGNKDICVATSTGGSPWASTPVTIDEKDQTEPTIAIGVENTEYVAYIVWTDARNAAERGTDIYGAKFITSWSIGPLVETASNQSSPVGVVSNGVIHLLWIDESGPPSIFYGNNEDSLPFTGTIIVDEPKYAQSAPAIAVNGTKIFACWQDGRWIDSGDDADIYFAERGSSFGTNILVNDDGVGNTQAGPDIGVDKDGNPYIVWVDDRNNNNDIYYAGATAVNVLDTNIVDDGSQVTVRASTVDDLQVTIPAGALPDRVDANNITIAEVSNLPAMPAAYGDFGTPFKFGPSGLHFNSPVKIRIPHSEADCPGYSIYRIYRYDPSSLTYWSEDGIHNPATHSPPGVTPHYLEVEVDHFSTFSPGGSFPPPPGGGGGGGGGCSMSPYGQGSIIEFLLPYIAFVIVLLVISCVDARRRRTKCDR